MGNTPKPQEVPLTEEEIQAFCAKLRPLDLLVFRGTGFHSDTIKKAEKLKTGNGDISHVEVVITKDWCDSIKGDHPPGTVFCWGSMKSSSVPSAETGNKETGVQIRRVIDVVRAYAARPGANVGICRLLDNPIVRASGETPAGFAKRTSDLKKKINSAYEKYNGESYDSNPVALIAAVFPAFRRLRNVTNEIISRWTDANKWLFCSEFVAVLYIEVGVINDATDGVIDGKTPDAQDVLPVDLLGHDADANGIVVPICEVPPLWIKPEVTPARKSTAKKRRSRSSVRC